MAAAVRSYWKNTQWTVARLNTVVDITTEIFIKGGLTLLALAAVHVQARRAVAGFGFLVLGRYVGRHGVLGVAGEGPNHRMGDGWAVAGNAHVQIRAAQCLRRLRVVRVRVLPAVRLRVPPPESRRRSRATRALPLRLRQQAISVR
mgnify:CR=1 FL=1